jgi:hypothetical protein
MSNLIDELNDIDDALLAAEERHTEASRILRQCKNEVAKLRKEERKLIKELKTGQSRYPLIERIGTNGDALPPTADERQRGPTAFQPPPRPPGRPRRPKA